MSRSEEPLWYLRGVPYSTYLGTIHWRRIRRQWLTEMAHQCDLCGLREIELDDSPWPDRKEPAWNVHHVTYDHLGEEDDHPDDLILLCAPCHNFVHHPESPAAVRWANDRLTAAQVARGPSLKPGTTGDEPEQETEQTRTNPNNP